MRAWRCGRPAGLDDPDDDDGDDDGDFDLGVGGFSRDAYNRYGGGLEEEEEEDGEDERDIGFPGDDDDDHDSDGDDDIVDEGGIAGDGVASEGVAAGIAAGLFQGDAGARLASLTLKNESYGQRVLENLENRDANENLAVSPGVSSEDADDAPTVPVPAFAGTLAGDADEDDVVLADEVVGDEAEEENAAGTVVVDAGADDADADALVASEFGAVRYWGSSIDTSLVPDDV